MSDIPDNIKLTASLAAPGLSFLGIPVQQWTYVLSAIVSILFIIEKAPMAIKNLRTFKEWIKKVLKR